MGRDLAEKFPNPPLKEVAFEIRFPPDLRVLQELYKFQQKVMSQLPKLGKVPGFEITLQSGIPSGVPSYVEGPWLFDDEEGNIQVKVAINSLAIVSRRYKSFDIFYPRLKELTETFVATYGLHTVTRVGLRYINDIDLGERPKDAFRKYIKTPIDQQRWPLEHIVTSTVEIRKSEGDSALTLRTVLELTQEGKAHYGIDIDAYSTEKTEPSRVWDVLAKLHTTAIQEFYSNITDAFIDEMRRG